MLGKVLRARKTHSSWYLIPPHGPGPFQTLFSGWGSWWIQSLSQGHWACGGIHPGWDNSLSLATMHTHSHQWAIYLSQSTCWHVFGRREKKHRTERNILIDTGRTCRPSRRQSSGLRIKLRTMEICSSNTTPCSSASSHFKVHFKNSVVYNSISLQIYSISSVILCRIKCFYWNVC